MWAAKDLVLFACLCHDAFFPLTIQRPRKLAPGELAPWLVLGGTLQGENGRKRACGAFSGFGRVFYRSRVETGLPPVPRGLK